MKQFFRSSLVGILASHFVCSPVLAVDSLQLGESMRSPSDAALRGSVYVYGDQSLDVLIPVRIIGAVAKGGIHFVPQQTDLITLISLAGGTIEKAELDNITIRRELKGKEEVIPVNLEALVRDSKAATPKLMANDTILIPVDKSVISDDVLKTMSIITGLATVAIAVSQLSK